MRTRDREKFARRNRKVAAAIRQEPERFRMMTVFGVDSREYDENGDSEAVSLREWVDKATVHTCGTTACIAGWALALNKQLIPTDMLDSDWDDAAAKILGIPNAASMRNDWDDPASGLFYRMDIDAEEAADILDQLADEFEAGVRG